MQAGTFSLKGSQLPELVGGVASICKKKKQLGGCSSLLRG